MLEATPDEIRERVLVSLKARAVEGVSVDVDPDLTVSLGGELPDVRTLRLAVDGSRAVRGVSGVAFRILVKGQAADRLPRSQRGPLPSPDVV